MQTLLVTGGAGFIGANFVHLLRGRQQARVINLDKLTYAGNPANLAGLEADSGHVFVRGDIADQDLVLRLLAEHRPAAIVDFAAETHVDRSIHGPAPFVETNLVGTFHLLEAARAHLASLPKPEAEVFRFLHVSTDEVYGSLGAGDAPFTERSPYQPNSPYAASKAGGDHLVRAYHHTYGLPTLITNCSNNYGPFQHPEKLMPLMICSALEGRPLPVYGDGQQVRDWVYVMDHCEAIWQVLQGGRPGETYNIGGQSERRNIDVVRGICALLDEALPQSPHAPHERLIQFVTDRPGHDRRYAIDNSKMQRELGWRPRESIESGLAKTVRWYLEHAQWIAQARSPNYRTWMRENYQNRVAG